jgi:hypothetical protein
MMGKKQVVYLRRRQSHLDEFVGGRRPTVKHQVVLGHDKDLAGTKSRAGGYWRPCANQKQLHFVYPFFIISSIVGSLSAGAGFEAVHMQHPDRLVRLVLGVCRSASG